MNYKLIRDKIPEIIEENGKDCYYAVAGTHDFYFKLLCDKLHEEAEEVRSALSSCEICNELADMYELIKTIADLQGYSMEQIREISENKYKIRGGFEKKYIGFFDNNQLK